MFIETHFLTQERARTRFQSTDVESKSKFLSLDELISSAESDFSNQINSGLLSIDDIQEFIRKKVIGVKINGVNVISIDFEHSDEEINPVAQAYLKSPSTRVIVVEYFYPEIKKNAERIGLLSLMNNIGGYYSDRIVYSKKISDICREANKPVAVTDIANKASYISFREFFRNSPQYFKLMWEMSGVYPELINSLYTPITLTNIAWILGIVLAYKTGKGIFNKEKISGFEKFFLDFEQARRLYAAKGIEQLTKEYPPLSQPGKNDPQIIAFYPQAHGIRISDYLINPSRGLDKAKDIVYKLFGPGLDFSVRQWMWKDSIQKVVDSGYRWGGSTIQSSARLNHQSTDLANWVLFSDRKITI